MGFWDSAIELESFEFEIRLNPTGNVIESVNIREFT